MVQKNKEKLAKVNQGLKEVRTSKVKLFDGGRKAAPKKRKINAVDAVSSIDQYFCFSG